MKVKEIYLDYAATTPVDPEVIEVMTQCLGPSGDSANPSSSHAAGRRAKARIDIARGQIAERICAPAENIWFTSGATESDNLALFGVMQANKQRGRHMITSTLEHKAVLDAAKILESQGVDVTFVRHNADGVINPHDLAASIRDDTVLVSIMHVNNETGVLQDIEALGECCRERGVLFHVDAAQSTGKVPLSVSDYPVDLVSLTAHKTYGPMGVGAIYIRQGVKISPIIHGGEQEGGYRPGTLATHQIAGFGKAFALADPDREAPLLKSRRDQLWEGLRKIECASLNGHATQRSPHVLNVTFHGIEGESLRAALSDIAVSAGSACNSNIADPSHVLRAMGLSDALAASSLRFSVGRYTSESDIDYVLGRVEQEVSRLKELANGAPDWTTS
ncbi:MAG: IscS subfamily cysteine desulfurase [Rhodospirillaceae bacterium]|nr:IscS subfamily cysteine desulfurase [Rhodospirillaceae bacterium]|tara:strand:+ start:361 stop:1530 length:1170 start_codon:yes stop_codon:yes gene_type:complete